MENEDDALDLLLSLQTDDDPITESVPSASEVDVRSGKCCWLFACWLLHHKCWYCVNFEYSSMIAFIPQKLMVYFFTVFRYGPSFSPAQSSQIN